MSENAGAVFTPQTDVGVDDIPDVMTPEYLQALDYRTLTGKHPEYEKWVARWDDYRLMYKGGEEFMIAAGMPARVTRVSSTGGAAGTSATAQLIPGSQTRIPRRFLWQLEGEANSSYLSRLERSFPVLYVGPIIDYFTHYLFSEKAVIRPVSDVGKDTPDLPDWFTPFERDATGGGMQFFDFLRDQFKELLITRRAGWLIGSPTDTSKMSQLEAEVLGVDGIVLQPFQADEILDWERDAAGELLWVVVRKLENRRQFPKGRARFEVVRYADRNVVATWEAHQTNPSASNTPAEYDVKFLGANVHRAGKVPFVMPEIPEGLWVANKLGGWQLELFNQMNILSRGELLSCFIQPILTSNDDAAQSRVFGEGTLLRLRSGDGKQPPEQYAWSSANIDPLRFLGERIKEKRDEGYRIVHQMSLAIDGDSATAVARSGVSKIEERRATEVILTGFGGYARDMAIRTLNIVSLLLGDKNKWACVGFDNFQVSSLEEELQTAALVQTLGIKSRTFHQRLDQKMVRRVLDHEDEGTLSKIDDEICDDYDQQEAQADQQQNALTQAAVQGAPGAPPPIPGAKVNPATPPSGGMPPQPPTVSPPKPPGPQPAFPPKKGN